MPKKFFALMNWLRSAISVVFCYLKVIIEVEN